MPRRCLCLLLLFATCSLASCQSVPPPPISLPKEVRGHVGEFIPISADTMGTAVAWTCPDEGLRVVPASLLRDSRTAHVLACRPGRYRLKAITARGDQLSDWACCTVTIEDGPIPVPDSARGQRDGQDTGPLWLVVIEETAERRPQHAAIVSDPAVISYVREKGWRVRIADKDARDGKGQVPRDLAPYLARAKGKQLPYLILVDGTGKARHEGAVPAKASELLLTLSKVGG